MSGEKNPKPPRRKGEAFRLMADVPSLEADAGRLKQGNPDRSALLEAALAAARSAGAGPTPKFSESFALQWSDDKESEG